MKKRLEYWENLAKKIQNPLEVKNKRIDTSEMEIEFIQKLLPPAAEVLDLGCGTGLHANKLVNIDKVKSIVAVDKFESFTKFVTDDPKITVINADLIDFKIRKKFDIILLFGVAQCMQRENVKIVYQNIYDMLKDDGYFFMRNHCGITEDVVVDKFSEELNAEYFAEYRHLESEVNLLKETGFQRVDVKDIYPDEFNVWKNTRHFFFIIRKS